MLTDGVTTTADPERLPGSQVYEVTPVAVRVTLLPEQMEFEDAERVKLAGGFTTTATVAGAALVQPNALTPVTE